MAHAHPSHPGHYPEAAWLPTGQVALAAMLQAIRAAHASVRLEMYIIRGSPIAEEFREALTAAARRGAEVRVLMDAFGSFELPDTFWEP